MSKRSIQVRLIGSAEAIASAMDEARLQCIRRELAKYSAQEQRSIIDRVARHCSLTH